MDLGNEIILVAGVLSLLATFAGFTSSRFGTPLLLALIGVGMLAGVDGPGGIHFHNFSVAYLVGSLALAAILFQGGLETDRSMIREALWSSTVLATLGVLISASIIGTAAVLLFHLSWAAALLLGATTAPTDAAAVSTLLRMSKVEVPSRIVAALTLESGINDPMSVFLTLGLVQILTPHESLGVGGAVALFVREMGGGLLIGFAGGYALMWLFRWLKMERSAFPVLAFGCALTMFGGAEVAGSSGFMATYVAGIIVGNYDHPAGQPVSRFFSTIDWLAQNSLFLMLGLLVTPHRLWPILLPAIIVSAILVLLARPAAVMLCLLPFRWPLRESSFIAWAGLRGAVPIYLTIIPLLKGVKDANILFDIVFVVVIVSVSVQGFTVKPAARLLGLKKE